MTYDLQEYLVCQHVFSLNRNFPMHVLQYFYFSTLVFLPHPNIV